MRHEAAGAAARTVLLGCGVLALLAWVLGKVGEDGRPLRALLRGGTEIALPVSTLPPGAVDEAVAAVVVVVGAAVAVWYLLSALVFVACAVAVFAGRRWQAGEKLVERWGAPLLRGAASVVLGLLVAAGAGAAAAAGGNPPGPDLPDDLRWSPLQHSPAAEPGERADDVERPTPAAGLRVDPGASHVVRPGESLWSIAATHLRVHGGQPTDAAVAAEWPRWYAANSGAVGPDPDLIHPGQELLAPREGSHP